MADSQKPVIIIRRKKKGGHGGGHHGGAWKVAYADFVTAMMAFFLLLWLLNVTTSDQRAGLADYFAPAGISRSAGGAGGVMGGLSINAPKGSQLSDSGSTEAFEERTIPTAGKGQEGEEDIPGKADKAAAGTESPPPQAVPEAQALAEAMKKEEQNFREAEGLLKQAFEGTPGLKDLAQNLLVDRTAEGLRIQLIDREKFSMFPSGSAIPYEKARELMRLIGMVLARLPNHISVTGHTDSSPFPVGSRRDNWTLSSERANVSLKEIVLSGVDESRLIRVVGMADREPLVPENPKDPRNRRISIVLLRQTLAPVNEKSEPLPTYVH